MHREFKLAYAAGLFDGEGHIGTHKRGDGSGSFMLEMRMTRQEPILRLVELFGGGIRFETKKAKANHAPTWRWRITGKRAHNAYAELRPYLLIK